MVDMIKVKRMVKEGKAKGANLMEAVKFIWGMLYPDDVDFVSHQGASRR